MTISNTGRRNGLHPVVGESAQPVVLADHEARPVDLAELWRRQPIAIFFLRHFG